MFVVAFSNKKLLIHMELSVDFINTFNYDDVFAIIFVQNRIS